MTSSLTVYRASAGSGKTFNLVLQYLTIALKRPHEFKNILAITFTNKATEEFKRKLFRYLHGISTNTDAENVTGMIDELKKNGLDEKTIKQNSPVLLSLMLHNFSDISIMTIDAFFSRILKSFSLELDLNIGNEIEINTSQVLNDIINDFLNSLEENQFETEILQKFLLKNISEAKSRNIERQILSVSKEIFKDRYNLLYNNPDTPKDEKDYLKFIESLENYKKDFEQNLLRLCKEAIAFMESRKLKVTDFKNNFMELIDKPVSYFYKNKFEIKPTFFKILDENKGWVSGKAKKYEADINDCINNGLLERLLTVKDYHRSEYEKYISTNIVLNNIYSVALLKILKDLLYKYQSENNITLISELNIIISKLMFEQDIPFLYEKTGTFYKYILIDEFQDTSRLQFENLKPLIENSLSNGNEVFFVGDEKQSIYRFRDAHPETLVEIESHFDHPINLKELTENFRSRENIVNFNNEFFSSALVELQNDYLHKAYTKIRQQARQKNTDGYVSVEFIDNQNSGRKELWKTDAKKRLYEIINEQIAMGYSYKDILILVDKNNEGAEIIKFLKNEMKNDRVSYEIISSESLKLKYSPEVNFLLSLMTYLNDFNNNIAAYSILNFYSEHIDLLNKSTESILHIDDASILIEKLLPEEFIKHRVDYLKLPIAELVLKLIEIFDLYKFSGNFLSKFIDVVSDYSSRYSSDIDGFLNWWDEVTNDESKDFSIAVPDNLNAVEVMTIHKAKGLEKEIVIIPLCDYPLNPEGTKDTLWTTFNSDDIKLNVLIKAVKDLSNTPFAEEYSIESNRIMLDKLNKLYVAFTRAKEKLFVLTKLPSESTSKPKNEEDDKRINVHSLLHKTISASSFPFLAHWNQPNNKFELGENKYFDTIRSNVSTSVQINNYKNIDWRKEIIIKNSIDTDKLLNENIQTSLIEGNIIHKIFSNMYFIEDLEASINKIHYEGLISAEQIDTIKNDINELLQIKEVNSWFTEKESLIYNEKEIVLTNGEIIRPDKMIVKNNEIKLIEFKSTTTILSEHKKQMQAYEKALLDMNFKNIKKFVLYTRLKQLKSI